MWYTWSGVSFPDHCHLSYFDNRDTAKILRHGADAKRVSFLNATTVKPV